METTKIEVPVELKDALEELVKAAVEAAKRARSGQAVDTMETESELRDKARECERMALQMFVEASVVDAKRVRVGDKVLFSVGCFEAEYKTAAGTVRVARPLYRQVRNGPTSDIVGMKLGVVADGWLPGAASQMALLIAQGTSREAEAMARELGRLPYSRSSFERIGHAVGALYGRDKAQVDQRLIEEFEIPEGTAGIVVSLDRVSIPMEEPAPAGHGKTSSAKRPIVRNYRMAYCGSLALVDEEGETLHAIRYGSMAARGPAELVEGLASDVMALLDRGGFKVMLNADGAPELWHLLDGAINRDSIGVDAVRLIDMFHLLEKLGAAAQAAHGESAGRAVVSRWHERLLEFSEASLEILDELCATGRRDEPVHHAITYLQNNHDRMDYASARQEGLPIGSGVVEATCKSLVTMRMKRAGARWKEATGQHVLELRALVLSGRWKEAMKLVFVPFCQPVWAVA